MSGYSEHDNGITREYILHACATYTFQTVIALGKFVFL